MAESARRLPGAADLHQVLAGHWQECLLALGVADEALRRKKQQPCPMCGGTDRYCFDDKRRRGDYICRQCGAGDGFKLLMGIHGWSFREALQAVAGYLGYDTTIPERQARPAPRREPERAQLTARGRDLLKGTTSPEMVPDVVEYLRSRKLWPLPTGCTLQAHVGLDYYRRLEGKSYETLGRFPALVGRVQDVTGETITAHVTYLEHGRKLSRGDDVPARKLQSPVEGRQGCAIRLFPLIGDTLGVGEGIETCLAASLLNDLPVWSCLSTALLQNFEPPPGVFRVIVFADADVPGLRAAIALKEELEGRCDVEIRHPKLHDFAADWEARS